MSVLLHIMVKELHKDTAHTASAWWRTLGVWRVRLVAGPV